MLILQRKEKERIRIGEAITITIARIDGKAVKVGIDAPEEFKIDRIGFDGEPECPKKQID